MCPAGRGKPALPYPWPPWGAGPGRRVRVTTPSLRKSLRVWGWLGAEDKESVGNPDLLGAGGWAPSSPGGTCSQCCGSKPPNGGRPERLSIRGSPWGPGTTDRFWGICDPPSP